MRLLFCLLQLSKVYAPRTTSNHLLKGANVTDSRHRLPIALLELLDTLFVVLSFGLAIVVLVREQKTVQLSTFLSMRAKISDVLIFALTLFVYHVIFRSVGLYRSRRLSGRLDELLDVLKASTLSLVSFVLIGVAFSVRLVTLSFLLILWVTNTAIMVASRVAIRALLMRLRIRGRNLRYMLILGTNSRAVEFARKIVESPERGYRLLGFVDDAWPGISEFRRSGFTVVCDYSGLADFLRSHLVDEAVIYWPLGSFYSYWCDVASLCSHHGIIVRLNADTFGLKHARWLAEELDEGHYIATQTGAGDGWPVAVKRALDIGISVFLLLFLPLWIVVAIAIKLTSPGPVFFLQERVGLNKRRFTIMKFRTMVLNAERLIHRLESKNEVSGPVFKIRNDPRITSIGRFLRRSSIDELPQLLNVLKGDMSLVGPRPLPVRDYEGFNEDWQRRRFSVKPGITCLWQVNGRSAIPFDQWMLLDLKYMDEWSLWLDFKILMRTVPAVVRGSGAA
jgi:exopolysaccharide biosynthesis polyprenyl glycosylphosphotransferase